MKKCTTEERISGRTLWYEIHRSKHTSYGRGFEIFMIIEPKGFLNRLFGQKRQVFLGNVLSYDRAVLIIASEYLSRKQRDNSTGYVVRFFDAS